MTKEQPLGGIMSMEENTAPDWGGGNSGEVERRFQEIENRLSELERRSRFLIALSSQISTSIAKCIESITGNPRWGRDE